MSDVTTEIHDDSHDPFAEFDAAAGVGTVRDPFPVWAELLGTVPRARRQPRRPVRRRNPSAR